VTVSAPDALIHPARQQRLTIARAQTVPSVADLLEESIANYDDLVAYVRARIARPTVDQFAAIIESFVERET
jgi:hypothetical protein